jgi:hypothetical protein
LTSTAWAAISSLVAVTTTLVLVIFNWRYLRFVHQQSNAAMKQVELTTQSLELTRESLSALKKQIADETERERHATLAILGDALDGLVLWANRARVEQRDPNSRIAIIPENWNIVTAFLSHHAPELASKAYQAGREIRDAEIDLNRYVQTDGGSRSGNSSLAQLFQNLNIRIQHSFEMVSALINEVHKL